MYIAILGILLGLRLVLQIFLSFNIGPTVVSLTWIPLFVVGFIYGPIIGLMFGLVSDTIGYLLNPGIYMWEYAIQEPLIGILSGLVGVIYWYFKTKKWLDIFIFETFIIGLLVSSIILINQINVSNVDVGVDRVNNSIFTVNEWILNPLVLYISVGVFFILANILLLVLLKHKVWRLLIYITIAIITSWIIFSWIEGPWALLRYWSLRYEINLYGSNYAVTYLYLFIVRVFKSTIVIPIEIGITFLIVIVLKQKKEVLANKW